MEERMREQAVHDPTLEELERGGASLVRALRPFAREDRALSWRLLLTSLALQAVAMGATAAAPAWARPLGSPLIALLMVRLFIFVHDAEHGAIFRGSRLVRPILWAIGIYTLNAPPVWRENHGRHHRTNAQPLELPLAQYRVGDLLNRTVSATQWWQMTARERLTYRVVRSPVLVLVSWVAVFAVGHGLAPFLRDPRRLWHGVAALLTYVAVCVWLSGSLGFDLVLWVVLVPNALGSMLGTYLFVAQHSFPDARIPGGTERPQLVEAALHASCMFDMPAWMHWFTGNIGYHHVHHLNHRVPFYRLPEAMAAVPELQHPPRTSFALRDVLGVFRANVWDAQAGRMVSFSELRRSS